MIKILSIGNSFSQDSTRYLHQIAKADGEHIKVVNLFIGGCSLYRHYRNMLGDAKAYSYEFNGAGVGLNVTMKEALLSDEWDYITLQQVSQDSVNFKTYQPYLDELAAYVRRYAPKAKLLIHQVWGYLNGSGRIAQLGYENYNAMFADTKAAYFKAYEAVNADGLLPSGEAIKIAFDMGVERLHRDDIHMTLGLGRYLLGLVWYQILTGKSVDNNTFSDFDQPISEEEVAIAKAAATKAVEMYKKYN